jgi:HPt (histidine-containing phosphotransfer) domain-containing protein
MSPMLVDIPEDVIIKLLHKFLEVSDSLTKDISKSCDNHNLLKYVHKLKGTSSSIGSPKIADRCNKICKNGSVSEDDLIYIRKHMNELIKNVKTWLSENEPTQNMVLGELCNV